MKKILILLLLTIVCSCKTTKKASCDAYGKVNPDKNTLSGDTPNEHLKTR
jgi:hypothetical protein